MAITVDKAKAYVNPVGKSDVNDSFIQDCINEAVEMLEAFTDGETIPTTAFDRATLEVVSELYHRRQAPNGIYAAQGFEQVVRVARDPMVGAYPILSRFMVIGL